VPPVVFQQTAHQPLAHSLAVLVAAALVKVTVAAAVLVLRGHLVRAKMVVLVAAVP